MWDFVFDMSDIMLWVVFFEDLVVFIGFVFVGGFIFLY